MGAILRKEEHHQASAIPCTLLLWMRGVGAGEVTGSVYFSLGCTLAISLFPPGVAMTSILYLVLGATTPRVEGVGDGDGSACVATTGL